MRHVNRLRFAYGWYRLGRGIGYTRRFALSIALVSFANFPQFLAAFQQHMAEAQEEDTSMFSLPREFVEDQREVWWAQ